MGDWILESQSANPSKSIERNIDLRTRVEQLVRFGLPKFMKVRFYSKSGNIREQINRLV